MSGWNGKCAPHASSASSGTPYLWQNRAMQRTSAPVPYSVGVTIRTAEMSGSRRSAPATSATLAGFAIWFSWSQRGRSQTGSAPARISDATTDLCTFRSTSTFPPGPVTASSAVWIEMLEPQVVKMACFAPTASANSSSASATADLAVITSASKVPRDSTEAVRSSRPRPNRCPGNANV